MRERPSRVLSRRWAPQRAPPSGPGRAGSLHSLALASLPRWVTPAASLSKSREREKEFGNISVSRTPPQAVFFCHPQTSPGSACLSSLFLPAGPPSLPCVSPTCS